MTTSKISSITTASHETVATAKLVPDVVLGTLRCSVCGHRPIAQGRGSLLCPRCNSRSEVSDNVITLMPERINANNTRELHARTESSVWHVISSPFKRPTSIRRVYFEHAQLIRKFAVDIYDNASILYLFAGDGLEAHLSGIINDTTVLSDISRNALRHAQQRVQSYRLPKPTAYIQCDAEKLPFEDGSYDIVIAFKGIHHCLVPQSAMAEVWRVAKKRAIVFDNWQCPLTDLMYRVNRSSRIEYSGLKPNRFNRLTLQTMLYNAQIDNYHIETTMPYLMDRYIGWHGRKLVQNAANKLGQGNAFILVVDRMGTNLNNLAKCPVPAYEANPAGFVPSEKQPIIPL